MLKSVHLSSGDRSGPNFCITSTDQNRFANMKMTSDSNGTVISEKGNATSSGNSAPSGRAEVKNRLTFSIDSLVGKCAKDEKEDRQAKSPSAFRDISKATRIRHPSRSPSPRSKRQCPQTQQKPTLSRTPPANGVDVPSPMSHQQQSQRFLRPSAFTSPTVPSGIGGASFMAPPASSGTRFWELASVDPTGGWWKDTVTASMYHAAAALYSAYPWCVPQVPAGASEISRKQQLLLQPEHPIAMTPSPPETHPESSHPQMPQNPAIAGDQQPTFWHHHIAELLRQNGGHPVHHSRLYAGPEGSHAAANFLFAGCRKPKRIRTAFSPNQLMELEAAFEKNQYVVGNERKELARRLALTETQVKVWFQNRRTKAKRMKNEDVGEPEAATSSNASAKTTTSSTAISSQNAPGEEAFKNEGDAPYESSVESRPSSASSVAEDQEESENEEKVNVEYAMSGEYSN